MRRKISMIVICIWLVILSGCGYEAKTEEDSSLPNYYENSLVFRLPVEHYPFTLMGISDTHFYYYHNEVVSCEDGYSEVISFYRQALQKESEPVPMNLPSENLLMRSSYIYTDSKGTDIIYLLLGEEKGGKLSYFIVGYDTEGTLLEKIALQDTGVAGDYPDVFLKLKDGNFVVISKRYFFIADPQGKKLFSLSCPGTEFRGLVEISDEEIGISYAEGDAGNVRLAIVNRCTQTMSADTGITGDGNCLRLGEDAIVYIDETAICRYELATGMIKSLVELKGRNVDIHQIVDMRVYGDAFYLFSYSTDVTAAKYISYTAGQEETVTGEEVLDPEKYDTYGRRYIYLYDLSGDWPTDSTNPIDAFNEQSDSYQVVIRDYQYGDTYEYDVAKIVASGDYPDLIFSTYNSLIAAFEENDAFEDITPYIEDSENLSIEELSETVVTAYTENGKLFALPNNYTLSAFWGDHVQLGDAGWTVDEFLDWISEYPNAGAPLVGTRRAVYDACIPAILDMCIDSETGKATFDGEVFQSFITKVKALDRKESYTREEGMQMLEEMEGSAYCLYDGVSLSTIAREEYTQGRELSIKGYPSADGEPVAYINSPALSIMSTSEVKEGAYEFMEFYLLYMNEVIVKSMDKGVSGLWTVDRYLEQNREALLQADPEMGAFCMFSERQLDEVVNIIPYAVLKDYSRDNIKELIWEELEPFFENQKDAETVCNIIQSRVQMYLDENAKAE